MTVVECAMNEPTILHNKASVTTGPVKPEDLLRPKTSTGVVLGGTPTMRSGRRAHARPGGRVSKHGGHFGMLPASF